MYQLFNSPVGFNFDKMTSTQSRCFLEHFIEQIPTRIALLEDEVRKSVPNKDWHANYRIDSLKDLSRWLEEHTQKHELSNEERETLRQSIPGPLQDVLPEKHFELTPLNYSYARDIAMYLGEIVRHDNSDVQWKVGPKPQRSVYYNRPVIATQNHVFMKDPFMIVTNKMFSHLRNRKEIDLAHIVREWLAEIRTGH